MKNDERHRTNILDVAQDLVQRQSISGVSFQELAKRIGIKKGVCTTTETKDDLSVAMLDRVTEQLQQSFRLARAKPPVSVWTITWPSTRSTSRWVPSCVPAAPLWVNGGIDAFSTSGRQTSLYRSAQGFDHPYRGGNDSGRIHPQRPLVFRPRPMDPRISPGRLTSEPRDGDIQPLQSAVTMIQDFFA